MLTRMLGWFALAGLAVGLVMSFGVAPREMTQGNVQRIMYVHVPAAWVAYLAFGEVPDRYGIVGSLLIVGSGLYALHREVVRQRAIEHVREIRGMTEIRARTDRLFSVANAVEGGHERRDLSRQAYRLPEIGVNGHIFGFRIKHRKHRDGRPQDFHGKGLFRQRLHEVDDLLWNCTIGR